MGNKVPQTLDDHVSSPVLCNATMASLREEGEEFLLELIGLFVTEAPRRLAELTSALAEGNPAVAQRAAHTLKSSAAIFGAKELETLAAAAELAAQAGKLSEVTHLLSPLTAVMEAIRLALLIERHKIFSANTA